MKSPKKLILKYALLLVFTLAFKVFESQTLKDSLLLKLNLVQHDSIKAQLFLDLGRDCFYTNPDSSYYFYNQALELSQITKNKANEAKSYLSLGYYYDSKESFKKAIEHYSKAIELYKYLNDEKGVATCYNYIGYSFSYLNSLEKSLEYYHKSLKIFEKLNDSIGLADVYNSFGNLHYDQENYTKAKEYFLKSFEFFKIKNNREGIFSSYVNLGNAISEGGNVDTGLEYYFKAVVLAKELNDNMGIAINYNNIGDCYLAKGKYNSAMLYFNKALKILNDHNYESLFELVYANISNTYLKLEDYDKAISTANISLEYSKKASWAYMYYDNHLTLSEAYEKKGDYKKAYDNHKIFQQYSDSIFNAKRFEQLAKSEVLLELENQESKIDDLLRSEAIRKVELKNQKTLNYVLALFSVIFLTLIFLLYKQIRKRKIAYSLLTVQKEKAEESDRLKSSFLANMSHEIRTPMSAILGFSSLLKDDDLKVEKRNHFIDIINKSGERLMAIINDIIDISKIESNQLKVDIEEVKVNNVLKDIVEIQRETNNLLKIKEIDLKLNVPKNSENISIKTDETRLTQIFNNLINNASKFTNKGFVEVGYKIINIQENKHLEFYVKDTGCGIPKSKYGEIFNRFSQAGAKDFKTGNGLGLSICKGLMVKLGGNIWLESEVEVGTTFYFNLPY